MNKKEPQKQSTEQIKEAVLGYKHSKVIEEIREKGRARKDKTKNKKG